MIGDEGFVLLAIDCTSIKLDEETAMSMHK